MAQRLLLVALCAVIAVQLISSVDGARKSGCIARCNNGCRSKHAGKQNMLQCLMGCMKYPKNCLKCKKGDGKCYGCLPGYMLSRSKCIPCAIGCVCDENSQCLKCRTGYTLLTSGVCAACPPGCICDTTTGECTSCSTGYALSTPQKKCLACPANCADCQRDGPSVCNTCIGGFLLVDGACKACIAGCDDCTTGLTTCKACKVGYLLTPPTTGTANTCTACPANCLKCENAGASYCDECAVGYGFTSNRKGCVACAPNCKKCNWNGFNSCDSHQCSSGFAIDTSKTCSIPCMDHCDVCTESASCLKCLPGFKYDTATSTCVGIGEGCAATPQANCAKCTAADNAKCEVCGTGYGLKSDGSCVDCDAATTDLNCLSCSIKTTDGTVDVCTKCTEGYLPTATSGTASCTKCADGCKDCTATNADPASGDCINCAPGYTLNPTTSLCVSDAACAANCASPFCSKHATGCDLICGVGFRVADNFMSCEACTSGCKRCSASKDMCDDAQCDDGYTVTADNKCVKS